MLIIDDFLTRKYWVIERESNWCKRIPLDYKIFTIEDELNTLKKLKENNVKFVPFITGYVLDMALGRNDKYGYGGATQEELKKAIMWLIDNKIRIGAHGYYHTEQELEENYVPWAKKILDTLSLLQEPPHLWRFPQELGANKEYFDKLGFEIISHPDIYYDNQLKENLDELFELSKSKNVMVHSMHLNKYL